MALIRCIAVLDKLKLNDEEAIGVNIVKRALEEPLRQIALNAGEEGAVIVGRVRDYPAEQQKRAGGRESFHIRCTELPRES